MKKPAESKPLIACLVSQVLKDHHPKLGLLQRVVSVLLYGNGVSKQVLTQLVVIFISATMHHRYSIV